MHIMSTNRVNSNFNYQFLLLTVLCGAVSSIKVDFGTRGGPIIPPTSTTVAPPSLPYREPAPVWEEPNDIPNPRPYVYELPPPSRSRGNTLNIFDPSYKEVRDNPHFKQQPHHQPQPVTPSPILVDFSNQFGYRLVPVYIPGEGYRYLIAMPVDKWRQLNTNHIDINDDQQHNQQKYDKYDKYDKYNGRYNAKLKKYKAYEKFLKPQQQQKQQPVKRDLLHHHDQQQQQLYRH